MSGGLLQCAVNDEQQRILAYKEDVDNAIIVTAQVLGVLFQSSDLQKLAILPKGKVYRLTVCECLV